MLKQLEPLTGIWRHDRHIDKPALYVFDWGHRCVTGRKLCYDVPGQEPFADPFQQVGPGLNASVQHVDHMHCLLTVQTGTPRSPITKAVQAATAVAVGGIPIPKRVSMSPHLITDLHFADNCTHDVIIPFPPGVSRGYMTFIIEMTFEIAPGHHPFPLQPAQVLDQLAMHHSAARSAGYRLGCILYTSDATLLMYRSKQRISWVQVLKAALSLRCNASCR